MKYESHKIYFKNAKQYRNKYKLQNTMLSYIVSYVWICWSQASTTRLWQDNVLFFILSTVACRPVPYVELWVNYFTGTLKLHMQRLLEICESVIILKWLG